MKLNTSYVISRIADLFRQSFKVKFRLDFTWYTRTTPNKLSAVKLMGRGLELTLLLPRLLLDSEKRSPVSVMEGSGLSLSLRTDSHHKYESKSDGGVHY